MIQFHLGVFADGGAMLCYSLDVNSQRKVHLHSRDADLEIEKTRAISLLLDSGLYPVSYNLI